MVSSLGAFERGQINSYGYKVGGKTFSGSSTEPRYYKDKAVGDAVDVYYDLARPDQSSLVPFSERARWAMGEMTVRLVFVGLAFGLAIAVWLRRASTP